MWFKRIARLESTSLQNQGLLSRILAELFEYSKAISNGLRKETEIRRLQDEILALRYNEFKALKAEVKSLKKKLEEKCQ